MLRTISLLILLFFICIILTAHFCPRLVVSRPPK